MKKTTLLIICVIFLFAIKGICGTIYTLGVIVYGNGLNGTGYSIDGNIIEYGVCMAAPSIHIAIIDSISCNALSNCNRDFGQYNYFTDTNGDCIADVSTIYNCRARAENYFIYRDNEASAIQRMAQLLDSVENGHIIIAYSVFPYTYSTMDPAFINIFQSLGSTLIPTMSDTVPFIFICRKGDINSIHEIVGTTASDTITMTMTYSCSPTGIEEMNASSFSVYPNPVDNNLHIDFKNDFSNGKIKIYDALGNLISERKKSGGELVIGTESFSPGIYFIRLESSDRTSIVRFCKTE